MYLFQEYYNKSNYLFTLRRIKFVFTLSLAMGINISRAII